MAGTPEEKDAHRRFAERFRRDGAEKLCEEKWAEWVNALPEDEFFAMMAIGHGRK